MSKMRPNTMRAYRRFAAVRRGTRRGESRWGTSGREEESGRRGPLVRGIGLETVANLGYADCVSGDNEQRAVRPASTTRLRLAVVVVFLNEAPLPRGVPRIDCTPDSTARSALARGRRIVG